LNLFNFKAFSTKSTIFNHCATKSRIPATSSAFSLVWVTINLPSLAHPPICPKKVAKETELARRQTRTRKSKATQQFVLPGTNRTLQNEDHSLCWSNQWDWFVCRTEARSQRTPRFGAWTQSFQAPSGGGPANDRPTCFWPIFWNFLKSANWQTTSKPSAKKMMS